MTVKKRETVKMYSIKLKIKVKTQSIEGERALENYTPVSRTSKDSNIRPEKEK